MHTYTTASHEAVGFDEQKVIHDLKHYLPTQTPLKDFIHHNTLHAFQDRKFYDAIFKASAIFGFEVTFPVEDYRELYRNGRINAAILDKIIEKRKGIAHLDEWKNKALNATYKNEYNPRVGRLRANWKAIYHIDLDTLVQPLLFRILSGYTDQGIALWHFPFEDKGLIFALQQLEKTSLFSFFKTQRAKKLLFDDNLGIEFLLDIVVGKEAFYEQYIFDQQCSHRGWSGMVSALEDHPDTLLYPKKIALKDLIILDLLLEIDALDSQLGSHWQPQAIKSEVFTSSEGFAKPQPLDLFAEIEPSEIQEVLIRHFPQLF